MKSSAALLLLAAVAAGLLWSGCSLFSTREPEPPITSGGTFAQADTPEQVIENVKAAIAEMNALNYRRSLSDDFKYTPTVSALARHAFWSTWDRADEERYFSTLAAAYRKTTTPDLQFFNSSIAIDREDRYVFDANYVLKVDHSRPEKPKEVQGHLTWVIVRGQDGLWSIAEWTDQQFESTFSWSDLKASFYN